VVLPGEQFLGDSITEGWDDALWNERYGPHHAVRLGLGGVVEAPGRQRPVVGEQCRRAGAVRWESSGPQATAR
jgi:hypothetical protein